MKRTLQVSRKRSWNRVFVLCAMMPSRDEDFVPEVARCTPLSLAAGQLIRNLQEATVQEVRSVGRAVCNRAGAEVQKCASMLYAEDDHTYKEIQARTGTLESLMQANLMSSVPCLVASTLVSFIAARDPPLTDQ